VLRVKWASVILAACLISDTSYAETSQVCVDLARALTSVSVNMTDERFRSIEYYANCESSSRSSNAGFDAVAAVFSLGGKWSDEKKRQVCSKNFRDNGLSVQTYSSATVIFDKALGVITQCLAHPGWTIKYSGTKNSFGLTINAAEKNGNDIEAIEIEPPDSLTCKNVPSKFPYTVTPTKPVALFCRRTPKIQIVDRVSVESAQDATINLILSDGPYPITLPGYTTSVFDELKARVDELGTAQSLLSTNLQTWPNGKNETKRATPYGRDRHETTCEDGYYAVGVAVWNNGIDHARDAVNDVQLICRKLNTGER